MHCCFGTENCFCCLRHRRTFETSLLVDESISDELPYSGELYLHIPHLPQCVLIIKGVL